MRKRLCKVKITKRDFDLFFFLFKYKVGTIRQLATYPFEKASYSASRLRLNRLVKGGYLKRNVVDQYRLWRSYYSLTDKSFSLLADEMPYTIIRGQRDSNHPLHDLDLVDVGEWIKGRSLVEEYIPENLLQCCEELSLSGEYMDFSQIRSDGAFKIKLKDECFKLALEYESSLKSKQRIRDKLSDYLPLDHIRAVFYVCKDESIEQSIRQIEKEVFTDSIPRVYYCQLNQILSSQRKVTFTDSHNGKFLLE